MARLNSFHLPTEDWAAPLAGDGVWLDGAEGTHLTKVLRTPPGTRVRLFDGYGREGFFVVSEVQRKKAFLVPEEISDVVPRGGGVTLAVGWTRASRRGWLVEKSVEFEAVGLTFWQALRSQGKMPEAPKDSWTDRAIQSAKQCFNPWVPELSVVGGLDDLIKYGREFERRFVLWEAGEDTPLLSPSLLGAGRVLAVIGPEGGLTDDEVQALVAGGFQTVTLGRRILRLETAALHCLSLAFHARQAAMVGEAEREI